MTNTTNNAEFNFKEFLEELLNDDEYSDIIQDQFFCSDFEGEFGKWDGESDTKFKTTLKNNNIKVEHQDNYGGEGMGEDYWSVYKFTKGNESIYVKFQGWYQSYNGSEFTEWFFVEPKQVQVTRYEKE